ncbi:hypothetical protein HY642_00820, partial [Candidatus Woesearchaeota archaeon]|nr:hypothetical protein [Candidatus Woesearchaeota archaeon]
MLTVPPSCGDGICAPNEACPADCQTEALFRFNVPPRPENFVVKLTTPALIQQARDILAGRETRAVHVMGTIVKQQAGYNLPWTYQLDPASISFFENAVEVCDAGIQFVQDRLAEVGGSFLPNSRWCPWGSRLVGEVPAQAPTASPTPSAPPTGGTPTGQVIDVVAKLPGFTPNIINARVGDRIRFTSDDVEHSLVAPALGWNFPLLPPGGSGPISASRIFVTVSAPPPGTYQFHCGIHPGMTGTLVVQ